MSRDLRGALHDWAEQEQRTVDAQTTDTARITTGLTRRVVRRRAVRAGTSVAAAAVLVGGVALGVHALDREAPVLPADPTPSPTSTPGPSPTPDATTPAPTPIQTAPEQPAPSVLTATPLPDGLLAQTDDTWHLVRYGADAADGTQPVPYGLYLISPDGPVYSVPTPLDLDFNQLHDWLPGTSLVIMTSNASPLRTAIVDVLSGEEGPSIGNAVGQVRFARDGSRDVWFVSTLTDTYVRADAEANNLATLSETSRLATPKMWLPNGDRTVVVVNSSTSPRAVDLTTLQTVPYDLPYSRPDACAALAWADDQQIAVTCMAGGAETFAADRAAELWLVPVGVDGGQPRQITGLPALDRFGGIWRMGDRLIVGTFDPASRSDLWQSDVQDWWEVTATGAVHLSTTHLSVVDVSDVTSAEIVVQERGILDDGIMWRLTAIDPFTGGTNTLLDGVVATSGSYAETVLPRTPPMWAQFASHQD